MADDDILYRLVKVITNRLWFFGSATFLKLNLRGCMIRKMLRTTGHHSQSSISQSVADQPWLNYTGGVKKCT